MTEEEKELTQKMVSVFRAHCVGFEHAEGKPLHTACFTMGTGRDYDLYSYNEVESMVEELTRAERDGDLSPCQLSVLKQLKSYGILKAFYEVTVCIEGL